jgi:CxxC motif-containing protein (DUF1111 family)
VKDAEKPGELVGQIAEGEQYPGGKFRVDVQGRQAFSMAGPGLSATELNDFTVGNSLFRNNWVVAPASTTLRDGLGPLLNAASCGGCHRDDGRAAPTDVAGLLFRLGTVHGAPDIHWGHQLQDRAIPGIEAEGQPRISVTEQRFNYPDGSVATLLAPSYEVIGLAAGTFLMPRIAQQIPGLGLLEAVSEQDILARADETDANQDGISGRAAYQLIGQSRRLGRFGWKATQPTLRLQAVAALGNDIGITSEEMPEEELSPAQRARIGNVPNGGSPEITRDNLSRLTLYLQALAMPKRVQNPSSDLLLKGKVLFYKTGCENCHRATFTTQAHPLSGLGGQKIFPYTDLLLHDMGPALADGAPEGTATGAEWRTAPLWGGSHLESVSGHRRLLHDGRAVGTEEAILWHGGESEPTKIRFTQLRKEEREALIGFVESL